MRSSETQFSRPKPVASRLRWKSIARTGGQLKQPCLCLCLCLSPQAKETAGRSSPNPQRTSPTCSPEISPCCLLGKCLFNSQPVRLVHLPSGRGVSSISPTPRINCFISSPSLSNLPSECGAAGVSFPSGHSACAHCLLSSLRKPSHGCRAAPKAKLEAKPASSPFPSHPSLAQITQFRMMVSLGHLSKGASLDDLIDSCIQSFGEWPTCMKITILLCASLTSAL